ncbi:MAG: hypothetical protein ABJD97_02025 [Betaproteobacteria bacterium]
MIKPLLASFATALALCGAAGAATVVDTGTPDGVAVGSYAFDGSDWYAAQVSFASASTIDAILGHVLGGTAGETFTVSLYADDASHLPGTALYTGSAVFGADGWNGLTGLGGWNVAAGDYWVGLEILGTDTLGAGSVTGALLDQGAPAPLAHWAWDATGGFGYDALGTTSIGLRVDAMAASTVPWPASANLMAAGLALLAATAAARRRSR